MQMQERLRKISERREAGEGGFTLIELLVVIVILGILAAVVVFAVGGVGDKGQSASCVIDTRTLRTAEEAYLASATGGNGNYGTQTQLVNGGFLSTQSAWHDVTQIVAAQPNATPPVLASFKVMVTGGGNGKCGATNDLVAPDGPGK
jgi:general secretion pathway protein G